MNLQLHDSPLFAPAGGAAGAAAAMACWIYRGEGSIQVDSWALSVEGGNVRCCDRYAMDVCTMMTSDVCH